MKIAICFLLLCALYAGECSSSSEEISQETTSPDRISAQGLEVVLEKLEQMRSKLLELQSDLMEQRKEIERNQVSNEKMFMDFAKDVARNISQLQDQSQLILGHQTTYASQEQFVEKSMNFTTKENQGHGSVTATVTPSTSIAPGSTTISATAPTKTASIAPLTTTARTTTESTTPPTTTTPGTATESTASLTTSTQGTATESTSPLSTTTPETATESTTLPTTTTTLKPQVPSYSSCRDVPSNESGVYRISLNNESVPFYVYCEQEKFGGGWIVMQHRFDGSVDFYRNWEEYRNGFGELDREFWFGLEQIHQITSARKHELVVEIKDFRGNYGYARYSLFQIGNEKQQYHLKTLGLYKGTAGDALGYSRVKMFSTKDRDNDGSPDRHYAAHNEGAWWYGFNGSSSNLNGRYMDGFNEKSNWWNYYKNFYLGLKFTRMMIREIQE